MKAECEIASDFKPRRVSITLETERELEEFYFLFNFTAIISTVKHLDAEAIRGVLGYRDNDGFRDMRDTLVKECKKFL